MKLPIFFYIIIYWVTAIVVNIIFKHLFGYLNFTTTWNFGFVAMAILSFDFTFVYIIRKKFSASLSASILLFLSIITVILMLLLVWDKSEKQTLLGQFILNYTNLIFFLIILKLFWEKFKFEYLNHFIVLVLFSLSSSLTYIFLYRIFSGVSVSFKIIFIKQLAFVVPYPFIFRIAKMIMNTLENDFNPPVKRIIMDDKHDSL